MTAAPPALGARAWATVVLVGLVGQLAWTIENMYLNVFVYNTITTDPTVIARIATLLGADRPPTSSGQTRHTGATRSMSRRRAPGVPGAITA